MTFGGSLDLQCRRVKTASIVGHGVGTILEPLVETITTRNGPEEQQSESHRGKYTQPDEALDKRGGVYSVGMRE